MTRLDLEVRIEKAEPSLVIQGMMTLRLDQETSQGPTLWLNLSESAMKWIHLRGEEVARVEFDTPDESSEKVRYAAVELKDQVARGEVIALEFMIEKVADSWQLVTRPDVALASWVDAWYPVALVDGDLEDAFSANGISIPGITTLNLPGDWIGIADGRLVRREKRGDRTVEVWDLTDNPVARSFAAGAYTSAERTVDDRAIHIYLMDEHILGADRLAELLAQSMAAQEARLGPFPFSGYGVVEVPDDIATWGAASQQTFIMAKGGAFEHEHGNLPLWAHEMCHGWWGNTVGSKGPGQKMAGEALAQFGVLIALEALEGTDAMIEFLEFSRSGYSSKQCARGYFQLVDQGTDHPLATLRDSELSGGLTHNLADSKGMWVYHMLRRRIGDDLFFATLRGLIGEYAGQDMTLDDIRQAFMDAAPESGLDLFFLQWLDRVGAPRIDVSWSKLGDNQVEILLSQKQDSAPFELDLELEIVLEDGSTQRETVQLHGRETGAVLSVPSEISSVVLDPDRDLLIWRDSYIAAPVVNGTVLSATASWVDPAVYAGTYEIEKFGITAEVFSNDRGLWVRIVDDLRQLFPLEPHRFMMLTEATVDFTVKDEVATGFAAEFPNGTAAEGVRIE
jgi:aminopeptidase N